MGTPMEKAGVEGIRISEGSGSGLGRDSIKDRIKRNFGKGDCVWQSGEVVGW